MLYYPQRLQNDWIEANTFNNHVPWAAGLAKLVTGNTRVRASVRFGDIGYPKASTLQYSNSAMQTYTHMIILLQSASVTNQQSTKAIYFFDRIKVRCEVLQLFKTWDFWRDLKCVMQDDLVVLTETVSGQKRAVLKVFQPLHIAKNPLSCQISNPHLQQTAVNMFLRGIRVALKCLCFMLLGYFPYTI